MEYDPGEPAEREIASEGDVRESSVDTTLLERRFGEVEKRARKLRREFSGVLPDIDLKSGRKMTEVQIARLRAHRDPLGFFTALSEICPWRTGLNDKERQDFDLYEKLREQIQQLRDQTRSKTNRVKEASVGKTSPQPIRESPDLRPEITHVKPAAGIQQEANGKTVAVRWKRDLPKAPLENLLYRSLLKRLKRRRRQYAAKLSDFIEDDSIVADLMQAKTAFGFFRALQDHCDLDKDDVDLLAEIEKRRKASAQEKAKKAEEKRFREVGEAGMLESKRKELIREKVDNFPSIPLNVLGARLRAARRTALRQLDDVTIPEGIEGAREHMEMVRAELPKIIHPYKFFKAVQKFGIGMDAYHAALVQEWERRLKIIENGEDMADVVTMSNRQLVHALKSFTIKVRKYVPEIVKSPIADEICAITNTVDFYRRLEQEGVDLKAEFGERFFAILSEYRKRPKRERMKLKDGAAKIKRDDPFSLGTELAKDAIAEDAERKLKEAASEDEREEELLAHMSDHQQFRKRWIEARKSPKLRPDEEYDMFRRYEELKRGILERILGEGEVMKRAAVLAVPVSLIVSNKNYIGRPVFGYQFFTSPMLKEPIDIFGTLDPDEFLASLMAGNFGKAKYASLDKEDGDADIEEDEEDIDFNINKAEICARILKSSKIYFAHRARLEKALKRRSGTRFDRLKERNYDHQKESNSSPVNQALTIFCSDPSGPSMIRALEYLRREVPGEGSQNIFEDFFRELRKLGISFSVKKLPSLVLECFKNCEAEKKTVADLMMRLRPSPSLIKVLADTSANPEAHADTEKLFALRDKITPYYMRNVYYTASNFVYRGNPPGDCVQYGSLGLLRAVDVYDYRRGMRFFSYIWRFISTVIQLNLQKSQNPIYLSVGKWSFIEKVRRTKRLCASLYGDDSPDRVYEELNRKVEDEDKKVTVEEVKEAVSLMRMNVTISLDTPDSQEDYEGRPSKPLRERLVSGVQTPEGEVILANSMHTREKIHALLGEAPLTVRQRRILQSRYLDGKFRTLEEVGQDKEITREGVRQLENRSLVVLRRFLKREGYKRDDF